MINIANRLGDKAYQQSYVAQNILTGLTASGGKNKTFDVGQLRQLLNDRLLEIGRRNPQILALFKESSKVRAEKSVLWFESNKVGRQILDVKI